MNLLLLLSLPSAVRAFSAFYPNCTAATRQVNWVGDSNARSTLDILWSCLFTIFTCTWTVLHLNVPEQRQGRDPGIRGDLKWKLKRFRNSLTWMFATISAPEYTLTLALMNLLHAVETRNEMKQQAAEDGVEWTLAHSFFANMGGFAIEAHDKAADKNQDTQNLPLTSVKNRHDGELEYEYPPTKRGSVIEPENPSNLQQQSTSLSLIETSHHQKSGPEEVSADKAATKVTASRNGPDEADLRVLIFTTGDTILSLRQKGLLLRLPDYTTEQINDKSKSDILIKSLTIIQVSSVTIQVIARHVQGLAISQLELAVTAFSFCSILIFSLLFHMPKDIQTPIVITGLKEHPSFNQAVELVKEGRESDFPMIIQNRGFDPGLSNLADAVDRYVKPKWWFLVIGSLGVAGALFGAIHCLAWSFSFPTRVEQIMWQTSSITTVVISIMLALIVFYQDSFNNDVVLSSTGILLVTYMIARMFIMFELFRALFYLPPSAFVGTWASSIPQFG